MLDNIVGNRHRARFYRFTAKNVIYIEVIHILQTGEAA